MHSHCDISPSGASRVKIGLNHDWRFTKRRVDSSWFAGRAGDDASLVDLPHCWNDRDTFQVGIRYYQGDGSYARTFQLPEEQASMRSGSWFLVTGGFYGIGDLWLNGRCIGQIDGQYLGIRQRLNLEPFGRNTIGIRIDNRYHPHVLPGKKMPDFLLHGGLAGQVTLEFEPLLHFDDQRIRVHCPDPMAEVPTLQIAALVHNDADNRLAAKLRVTITDPAGRESVISSSRNFSLGSMTHQSLSLTASVQNPKRWSLEAPNFYHAKLELIEGDRITDVATRRIGIRESQFRADGFYLNHERVQLYGANRHESMPGFGNALPPRLHREDAELMKRIGLNLVRLAHYPQHPEFLNACDELGILVYAEIASWKSVKQGAWLAAACRQWRAMILRDRHHPSIILWGMGNESRSGPGYRRMHTVAHELDGSRETVYAENHLHRGIRWRTLKLPDVLGVNYEIDRLEDARRLGRGPVLMSECSNCPRTYRGDPESETQQVETYQRDLDGIEAHDFAAGYCLWSFNDYATQRKERYIRCSGLVDAWRLPKPSAAYLSSRIKGSPTEAAISPGETTAIVIEAGAANYSATSRETVSLLCRAVDTHGNTATGWKGELAISLEGPARERLHNENAKLPMAAGSGRLFVTSTGIVGHVTVSATHPDLGQGMLTIEFSDSPPVIPELPLHDDIPHVALAAWASDRITTDKNERVDIRFAPGEDDLPDLIKRYLNDDLPGTTTVRAHKWGGRVVSAPVPPTGRTFFFKSFPANSPRFLHKPLRARHTLLQEDRLRAAGFAAPRSIGLALKRRAGVLVDSLVVSESAGDLPSLATLINDGEDAVRDRSLRRTLLKAAATEIGRFHRSGLFHGDMHLNNLLCRQSDGEFTFVWIDNEEGRSYESLPDEKRIHDLNHLNRQRHTLSRSERMLMWKTYIDATNVLSQDRAASILRKTISQSQAYMRKRGWL